ncbi:MAG: MMPL family transporter [Cellvibrio sp.]
MNASLSEKTSRRLTTLFQMLFGVVVLSFAIFIGKVIQSGVYIESDLQKLFPQDADHPLANHINQRLFEAFGNNLIIAISSQDKAQLLAAANKVDEAINAQPLFIREDIGVQLQQQQRQQALFTQHRYHLLTPEQRQYLTQGEDEVLFSDAARAVLGFRNSALSVIEDPFNLAPVNLQRLQLPIEGEIENDKLIVRSGNQFVILNLLKLSSPSFSMETQSRIDEWLNNLNAELSVNHADSVKLWVSGAVFHGAEASKNAQREMTIIGTGSIIGILVLFALAFRQFRPLVLTITSVAFGCGFAFFATHFVFSSVHLITLVFGASLIGVAVDYSLHYLCKQQATLQTYSFSPEANSRVRRLLLPALALSLLTSILGYSCLLQTPLIGLQQIACFSVLGLAGAWLWVVVLYPYLMPKTFKPSSPIIDEAANFCWSLLENVERARLKKLGVAALLIVVIGGLMFEFSRDVRTLYKPSPYLMASEQFLQKALQGVSPNQYFLVRASSEQALLEREAQFVREKLEPLVKEQALLGVMATSAWVPSIAQQTADYNSQYSYLFQDGHVSDFFGQLGMEPEYAEQAKAMMEAEKTNWLTIDDWLSVARPDQALLWQGEFNNEYVSVVALRGVKDVAALAKLQSDDIIFVDRVSNLSGLLMKLVQSAALMLVFAYLAISVLIVTIYRRLHSLGIVMVPLVSTLMVLGVLSIFGVAINLFHIFGCYLILGLGIDYAIFSYINGHRDFVARRAIWLAAMTSSLSFGLLALSQTPMVQSFGIVLALGCLINLTLAPLVAGLGAREE